MAKLRVSIGCPCLCRAELKDLANLCIRYLGCHPKCIGFGLLDITIAQPFVRKWEFFLKLE